MAEQKTHWKKNHNYNYLGAYSLPTGSDMILTIKEMKQDETVNSKGQREKCFVCSFQENVKPMILNKTNCKTIEKLYNTPFIEDWVGKKIQIYAAKVSAFGEETEALRIRKAIPGGKSEREILIELYKAKKEKMTTSHQRNAERIIKEEEKESYEKIKKEMEAVN